MRNKDPYWCEVKYATTCKCGKRIERGDIGFYYPNGRTMLCSDCGRKGENDFLAAISMERFGNDLYYER